jgi:hypothetical protein
MEGKNPILESRYADFHQERLPDLVAELLRLKTDVIVALGPLLISVARSCRCQKRRLKALEAR